jgi:effector-binding domain-containing protein
MSDPVELVNSAATLTAVVRDCVPPGGLPQFVPAACGEVWSFVRAAGLPKPGRHVALYLDAQGSVEVGAEVSAPFAGNDRVHCSQLPAGRVATTVHFGPYPRLFEAHDRIRQWCAGHGHRLAGISWEIYGHWEESWNANPSQIRTDVFYRLEEPSA